MHAKDVARHFVWSADPVLLRVGAFELRYYGLLLSLGIWLVFWAWYRRARANGETRRFAESWLWWFPPAVLIGGRVGHVLFYRTADFLADPAMLVHGTRGLSSHGVTAGLTIAAWGFARRHRRTMLLLGDYAATGIPLGAACVRFGNFINSEIVGRPSDVPWSVVFTRYDGVPRHPVQLYEIGALLAALLAIVVVERRGRWRMGSGMSIGLFLAAYFGLRFFAEFFKERLVEQLRDSGGALGALEHALGIRLTTGQWLSVVPAAIGVAFVARAVRRHSDQPARVVPAAPPSHRADRAPRPAAPSERA